MKYTIVVLTDARQDIEGLSRYLDEEFSVSIRDATLEKLFTQLEWLRSFPKAGRELNTIIAGVPLTGFYCLRTTKLTILYDIVPMAHKVRIARVLDNRRDVVTILKSYLA